MSKAATLDEARKIQTNMQVFLDGSGIDVGIGTAVVLFRGGEEK